MDCLKVIKMSSALILTQLLSVNNVFSMNASVRTVCAFLNVSEWYVITVAYPGIFFGGGSTNSVEDRGQRGWGSGGGSPLVRGSGGSCNLVQEISFHIVKFS